MNDQNLILLKDIHKSFMEGNVNRSVLRGLDFSLFRGQFGAVIGRSGSGKSTLLNLISGIDYPDSGEIHINGANLNEMNELERTLFRRKKVGFVFQFFNLLPTLTVLENVLLPLEINGTPPAKAKQQALPILEAVGLVDRAETFPDRLSGGEQQRVAIARALVNNPELVLADEPTGNLDRATGQQILNLLDTLTRQAGKSLILVTHSITSTAVADFVYRLEGGVLVDA
ncbi:MAG: ATP-binding cassette domain-containing protein [Gammaproteobacteria bacterium]|nr:ATP-binding cassette domain-containing protein [Gammaproteobacteria bacterium]